MPCSMPYWKAVLIAHDQLLNACLGGWPDETMSSRAHRLRASGKRKWPGKTIDWVAWHVFRDKNHCAESFESERQRRQLPPECRG